MSRASSSRSPTPEQPDDEGARRDAKSRKRAALFPPISSLCSALGGFEEFRGADGTVRIEYSLGDQVVGCLKDLKRFWKLDENDEDRTVARIFHQVGLLKNDLVPILLSTVGTGTKGDRIALACAELIAALTWPIPVLAELHSAQKLDELEKSLDYTSLITAQLEYKAIILRTGVLPGFLGIMGPSLEKNRRERQEKDENIISLILHVFRNLAAMRDRPSTLSVSAASMEETTLQSQFIAQLAEHNIFDLLLAIAGHSDTPEFGPWNLVVLDIFHLLFRCCKVEELIIPTEAVDDNRLSLLLEGENKTKRAAARKMTSRHSRFGTTVALQAGDKKYILHKASAATELSAAEKTMDGVKRLKAKKIRDGDMLNVESNLRPEAIKVLVDVATKFVESCFNPFFSSILKDIRMERLKVKESDTIKFLFLSRFFLEFFLLVFEKNKGKGKAVEVVPEGEAENEPWDFGLIAIMTEPASIGFVTARMKMAMDEKPVLWTELHAGVDCFTQVLLMIDTLALSEVEENIDVAEILQNKLYYEGETLDLVLRIVMGYSRQSLTYLDSVINLSYVLLRMLEKYSKSKAFMYVRKKQNRASRKKKNRSGADDEGDGIGQGDDEEEEEIERGTRTYKEHAFTFSAFETTFADESVLATCMVYLEGWKTFTSPEQLKRIVSLMHRMAVKAHSDGLFFKPTVLELFRRILADPDLLPTTPRLKEHADLKSLIEFILKKFFKTVKDNPLMLIEIFYPKSRSQLSKMRLGEEDPYANLSEEVGFGFGTGHQITGEVEVQPGFSHSQQIGIAIACLVDDGRLNLVERITSEMTVALAARLEIVLSIDGAPTLTAELEEGENEDEAMRRHAARLLGPSKDAIELFTPHAVHFEPTEMKAAGHNEHYKLLMRLLSWVSEEVPESKELAWKIPASILPAALTSFIKIITDFILDPLDPSNGKSAKDLLQKKRKPRGKRVIAQYVGESDGEDEDFGQKTSRVKAKRSKARMVVVGVDDDGENVLEEEVTTKRTKKRQQEQAAFKSAQFIVDSDDEDDPERDKAFFAAEQRLRDSLAAGQISNTTATASRVSKKKVPVPSQAKGKSRDKEKARTQDSDSSSEEEDIDERPVKPKRKSVPIRRAPSPIIESSPPPPPSSQRKRSLSAESPPPTATAPSTTSDGTALGTAPKRRRQVIADSDDE